MADALLQLGIADAAQAQAERHVLEDGKMRKQRIALKHQPDVATVGRLLLDGAPLSKMLPSVGVSNPAMQRKVVVLPQPLGPSSETNSPAATLNESGPTTD